MICYFYFLLSYKTTPVLSDQRKLSSDTSIWGRPIANSFSSGGDGRGNIDGDTTNGHVLCKNYVAIKRPAGLGTDALNLPKVASFLNENFSTVDRSQSKYGPQRSGPREWIYVSTEDYDAFRKDMKKLETLVGPDGERILRRWFFFVAIDGRLYGRRRSCFECKFCFDSDFLHCTNTIACGPLVELTPVEIEGSTRERSFVKRLNQPEGTTLKKVLNVFGKSGFS